MKQQVSSQEFLDCLLGVMDRKHHWAWPYFSGSHITKDQLKLHFRQEYAVYVRDFPVFLARLYAHNPPLDVRSLLAENIYEEDTGKLSLGRSHPDLFLAMMSGLGYNLDEFRDVALIPSARAYREWLEEVVSRPRWVVGAAVLTVLVEGSVKDRQELYHPPAPKSIEEIEDVVRKHPLAVYHGLSPEHLDLIRAHQMVETGHRRAAYHIVTKHANDTETQQAVLRAMEEGLGLWLRYRDGVASACGLTPTQIS